MSRVFYISYPIFCILSIAATDGGRMAQALFGRGAKLSLGSLSLLAALAIGIGGSDLFLFYL